MGATLFLIAALAVYGIFYFRHQRPDPQLSLPWGEQSTGTMAVEIATGGKYDGVYFPATPAGLSQVFRRAGLFETIPLAGLYLPPFPAHFALSATADGRIVDMPAVKRLALGLPIDLNLASVAELSLVPGIGAATAERIVAWRQSQGRFRNLADLKKVQGIKEQRLKGLGPYLQVSALH